MKNDLNEIGKNIKKYRELLGLNPNELSTITGVTRGYLLLIEDGRQNPSISVLRRLADGLGISPGLLIPNSWVTNALEDKKHIILSSGTKNTISLLKAIENNDRKVLELIELLKRVNDISHDIFKIEDK